MYNVWNNYWSSYWGIPVFLAQYYVCNYKLYIVNIKPKALCFMWPIDYALLHLKLLGNNYCSSFVQLNNHISIVNFSIWIHFKSGMNSQCSPPEQQKLYQLATNTTQQRQAWLTPDLIISYNILKWNRFGLYKLNIRMFYVFLMILCGDWYPCFTPLPIFVLYY